MADRADVYVKNAFLEGDIGVTRKLADGTIEYQTTITNGEEEMIHLAGPEVSLVIGAPQGKDINECHANVSSDVDLEVSHSRSSSTWTVEIAASDLPPEAPTTVNVTVGEGKPG